MKSITRTPSAALALAWATAYVLCGTTMGPSPTLAFAPPATTPSATIPYRRWEKRHALFARFDDDEEDDKRSSTNNNKNNNIATPVIDRFLSPRIDDNGLPLTDALIAQIVAPSLQIYWIVISHAPSPSWLAPISTYFGEAPELAPRGSLLAPTLIHGAGLAVCWIAGALAARMYEKEAFLLNDGVENNQLEGGQGSAGPLGSLGQYQTLLLRLVQAGAFATGILIVSTQLDLLLEYKRWIQVGESPETDFRILLASVEVFNDVFFEALVMGSWRIFHANFMSYYYK